MSEQFAMERGDDFERFEVFPWNRNLETGHAVIDEQHKMLVELLNQLARTLVGDEAMEVNQAFEALAAYADRHFADEEAFWTEYLAETRGQVLRLRQ